jgi:hypothetical protein
MVKRSPSVNKSLTHSANTLYPTTQTAHIILRSILAAFALAALSVACKRQTVEIVDVPVKPVEQPSNWEYRSDATTSWACVDSVDETAQLCFRRMQGHLDSYLKLPEEGNPFMCYARHCQTKIQLDAGAMETVQGADDENGGTRVLFLPAPAKLLNDVQHAKQLTIGPPMFGSDRMFVFRVNGLHWQTE